MANIALDLKEVMEFANYVESESEIRKGIVPVIPCIEEAFQNLNKINLGKDKIKYLKSIAGIIVFNLEKFDLEQNLTDTYEIHF